MSHKTAATVAHRNYNVRLRACELNSRFRYLRGALRQCVLNDEVAALDECLFLKAFPEAADVSGWWWFDAQKADTARRRMLAAGSKRPSGGTNEHCDEFAALHYSPEPRLRASIILSIVQ
jgi:hypothetical protein